MASDMNKKYGASIKGIVSIDGDKIEVEVKDVEDPINLAEFIKDFDGRLGVKITISYGEEF